MALAVPLARFTSRVGGGFLRHEALSALLYLLVAFALLALLVWTPCLVIALGLLTVGENRRQPWRYFGSYRDMICLLSSNAIVLAVFCGLWYWGYFLSERWMLIIYKGGPWSWFVPLFVASYIATLLPLRRHSKMMFTSLLGPVITAPVFYLWVVFCFIKFDPFF